MKVKEDHVHVRPNLIAHLPQAIEIRESRWVRRPYSMESGAFVVRHQYSAFFYDRSVDVLLQSI
jgi:hypothetical protein